MVRQRQSSNDASSVRGLVAVGLLLGASFTVATQLTVWREQSERLTARSGSVLQVLMGDSQRLFANHFFSKADVYLHSGVYPSIFDQARQNKKLHLSEEAGAPAADHPEEHHPDDGHDHEQCKSEHGADEHDAASGFLAPPRDWIDRFGRNFFPTKHVHLDAKGKEQEILPWLRLAADLNPNEVQTYTVASYWLRSRMGKVDEAEKFLRQGWRANPDSFEILFELGRLREENHRDLQRARTLYELALRKWQQLEPAKSNPDTIAFSQITGRLAKVEEADGRLNEAIAYLEMVRRFSPHPEKIDEQIVALRAKINASRG